MGTNYYLQCNLSNKGDCHDQIHIGKSSAGWGFIFRAWTKETDIKKLPDKLAIRNFEDWKRAIENKDYFIVDQYGNSCNKKTFFSMVAEKSHLRSHAKYVLADPNTSRYHIPENWEDELGHSFSDREFS